MRPDVDTAIARLARTQHGVFNRGQALHAGADANLIARRRASGTWVQLDRTVFALPGNPGTWFRQLKAAELSRPGSAVARKAAATLHHLDGFRPGRPELAVIHGASRRTSLALVHQSNLLEVTRREGIVVTTLAQTVHDLAAEPTRPPMAAVLSAALAAALDLDDLRQRCVAVGPLRRRGIGELHAAMEPYDNGNAVPASVLESRLHAAVAAAGITGVRFQFHVPWATETDPHRVDAAVPRRRLIVEADGRHWHAQLLAFERDRARDNQAARQGWRTVRLTWLELDRRFEASVALLRAAVAPPHKSAGWAA